MSVREYIGARYVPLFADPLTWDPTRTYEPLTVVLYNGNSYTSRQAVPVNIDITNTTYWVQTGNYNAQIEQYRAEVQTFDDRITQNTDDIDDLNTGLTTESETRATADSSLSARITQNTNDISDETTARTSADTALSARISTLEETPIMLVIGDSWSYHNDGAAVSTMWDMIVAQNYGMELHSYARGAVGYMRDRTNCFYDQLSQAANDLDVDRVKKVYIFGGLNDVYRTDVFYTHFINAVNATLSNARTLFPNCELIVAGIQRYQNGNIAYNTTPLNYFKIEMFTACLGDACKQADINAKFVSLQNLGLVLNQFYQTNGHPTLEGHKSIASKMLGGDCFANEKLSLTNGLGTPCLVMGDGTKYYGNDINDTVIHKGGNLYNVSFTFNPVDTSKYAGTVYIDFNGAPMPGKYPRLLGVQTGTVVTINAINPHDIPVGQYGNGAWLSSFNVPYTRASFTTNTILELSYDFSI